MKKKKKKYVRPTITVLSDEFDITMEELPYCSKPADEGSVMSLRKEYNLEDCEDDEWLPVAGKVRKRVWEDE